MDLRAWCMVALAGCGPAVGAASEHGSDTGAASDGSTPASTSGGATGGAGSDGGDGAVDDTGSTPSASLCGSDDPGTPLAVLDRGGTLAVLTADGQQHDLALPPAPVELAEAVRSIDARGEFVAVTRTVSSFDTVLHYSSDLTLLRASGELMWTLAVPDRSPSGLAVGDDGSVVVVWLDTAGATTVVLYDGGEVVAEQSGVYPSGPRRADGLVPGQRQAVDGTSHPGWWSPTTGAFQDLAESSPLMVRVGPAGEFVYLRESGGQWQLVTEAPGRSAHVTIDALAGVDRATLAAVPSPSWTWLLFHVAGDDRWLRTEAATGASDSFVPEPPTGLAVLDCFGGDLRVDDRGGVLVPTRDATAAYIHRFDPVAADWTMIGEPVTEVDMIGAEAYGTTHIVRSMAAGTTFCPPQVFEPGTTTLGGSLTQVVAAAVPALLVPEDAGWVAPQEGGACVIVQGGDAAVLHDLVAGGTIELEGSLNPKWWSASPD